MKEAILYDQLDNQCVKCHACLWQCTIAPERRGVCCTRENHDGRLFTLIYDQISSVHLDPIEKKPLYHFHPGTQCYSVGTLGCSFKCPGCQNYLISQREPEEHDMTLYHATPAQVVEAAVRAGAAGVCWTYNDPAIWIEHTLEGAKLTKAQGLYTVYVTNGTASREHLDLIGPYLDAYRVDIKAFSRAGYKAISGTNVPFETILENTAYAKSRWGMHVECVTNVTPSINDSEEELRGIAGWIANTLGPDTPWHITRFHPYEGFAHLPATPMAMLERAYAIGMEAGLYYIYVGNVFGDPRQDTHCPQCGQTVIRRQGFTMNGLAISGGKCGHCGHAIAGHF